MKYFYNKIYSLYSGPAFTRLLDRILPHRLWLIIIVHILLFTLSFFLSFFMLRELFTEIDAKTCFLHSLPPLLVIRFAVFWHYDLYQGLWRYVSFPDLLNIIRASIISSLLLGIVGAFWEPVRVPERVLLLDLAFCIMLVGGIRFIVRNFRENLFPAQRFKQLHHVILVGPLARVQPLVKEMLSDRLSQYYPVAVVDPTRNSTSSLIRISDVPVFSPQQLQAGKHRPRNLHSVVFCWPGAAKKQFDAMVDTLRNLQVPFKTLPHVDEILSGDVSISDIRDVEIEDLLERPPIQTEMDLIRRKLRDQVVLVTGGGGSIGSELCRQVAELQPRLLVIVERSESSLYNLRLELQNGFPEVPLYSSISSINDYQGLLSLMKEMEVDVVFHAAAYKHVPLMEAVPVESAYNNILGTHNVARAAREAGVQQFVMISTDKAVNPCNVMGVTKRIAEMVVQSYNNQSETQFMIVRFGNVLGSVGSVIPLFKHQIQQGGPVTITHSEIERYFMTISEAVQLILQASSMGEGGEIFVLDMGKPVRILLLAEKLITLSGKRPYEDVEIVFTGLRAGEKMYEELFNEHEQQIETSHPQIMAAQSPPVNEDFMRVQLEEIRVLITRRDEKALLHRFKKLVPQYQCQRV